LNLVDTEPLSLFAAGLLFWVAIVHLVMAFGVRRGELVWSGRYPRLLTPPFRWRSLFYAVFLLFAAWVLAAFGGVIDMAPVPDDWIRSAGWVVTVFLGIAALYSLFRGSKWERLLFGPITLFGAILAGFLTFG
jgi:hypothetical protein